MTPQYRCDSTKPNLATSFLINSNVQELSFAVTGSKHTGLRLAVLFAVLAVIARTGTGASSQIHYGSLTGTVTDPSGGQGRVSASDEC
jgi:hypothetical protein